VKVVDPEILEIATGLSSSVYGPALSLGVLLWISGWRAHRFWIVLLVTVGAGLVGLYSGRSWGAQPVLCGLLLALAAGSMALALVRVVAFAAGGLAAWLTCTRLGPHFQEPLLCFLGGGLLGLFLFKIWTMILTSAAASLLMVYSSLCLVAGFANLDVTAFARTHGTLLNFACGSLTVIGVLVQYLFERSRSKIKRGKPPKRKSSASKESELESAWSWLEERMMRRAG
jgi:hypothetical protein